MDLSEKKVAIFGMGGVLWNFLTEVLGTDPFFRVMSLFWFLDMTLGTLSAWIDPKDKFRTSKFLFGLVKWWVATVLIFTAWGFRVAPPPEDDWISFGIEYCVLFMFGHSLLKNASKLFKLLGGGDTTMLDKILGIAEDNANDVIERLRPNRSQEVKVEKVTETTTVTHKEEAE